MRVGVLCAVWLLAVFAPGCGDGASDQPSASAGSGLDAGADAAGSRSSAEPADAAQTAVPAGHGGGMSGQPGAGSGGRGGVAGTRPEPSSDAAVQPRPDASGPDAALPEPDGGTPVAETGTRLVVGVGDWGLRARSADGAAWSYCGNASTGNDHSPDLLRNVAYGAGVFIAVGGDANGMVMRSLDGEHWEEDLHPTSSCGGEPYPASCTNWMGGVAFGSGTWLAGGGNGALMRSRDGGRTWTGVHPTPTPNPIRDLAFGAGRFVAGCDQGDVIVSSDDGDSWQHHALWTYDTQIAYGAGAFIAWGAHWNGSGFDRGCFVSGDGGDSWDPCASSVLDADSFVHDGTRWIAARAGSYETSADAVTWAHHAAANFPALLLFDGETWFGRQGGAMRTGQSLDALSPAATGVPDFRAWTLGTVLDSNVPVSGVAPCQDQR